MSNPNHKKIWLNLFNLLLGTVKMMVFGICLVMLYTLFGDSFAFNIKDKAVLTTRHFGI